MEIPDQPDCCQCGFWNDEIGDGRCELFKESTRYDDIESAFVPCAKCLLYREARQKEFIARAIKNAEEAAAQKEGGLTEACLRDLDETLKKHNIFSESMNGFSSPTLLTIRIVRKI